MLGVLERSSWLSDPLQALELGFKVFAAVAFIFLISGLIRYELVALIVGILAAGLAFGCFVMAHHLRVHAE